MKVLNLVILGLGSEKFPMHFQQIVLPILFEVRLILSRKWKTNIATNVADLIYEYIGNQWHTMSANMKNSASTGTIK